MQEQSRAYAYVAAVILLWATVATAFKLTLQHSTPLQLVLVSSGVSAAALLAIAAARGQLGRIRALSQKDVALYALLGLLNPFLYYLVLFSAYSMLPAQEAQPLNQTWALIIPILSIYFLAQKIGWRNMLAIVVSFAGIVVISTHGDLLGMRFTSPLGAGLAVGSAFIWAAFWVASLRDKNDASVKLSISFCFGFLYAAVAAVVMRAGIPDGPAMAGSAYIGLFEMGITFFLWLSALKWSKTTAQVSNVILIVPFLSLVLINFVLREPVLLSTVAGLFLIILGILYQRYLERKAQDAAGKPGEKEIRAPKA